MSDAHAVRAPLEAEHHPEVAAMVRAYATAVAQRIIDDSVEDRGRCRDGGILPRQV